MRDLCRPAPVQRFFSGDVVRLWDAEEEDPDWSSMQRDHGLGLVLGTATTTEFIDGIEVCRMIVLWTGPAPSRLIEDEHPAVLVTVWGRS